jgi:hypothetical protein
MADHRITQRVNCIFVAKEFSNRCAEFNWFEIGGLHHSPLPGEKHQAKVQVRHMTQQRWYAAVLFLMERKGTEAGYDESVNELLDYAKLGMMLKKYAPQFCEDRLAANKLLAIELTKEELILNTFPEELTHANRNPRSEAAGGVDSDRGVQPDSGDADDAEG